jgi:prephenate dehydrogenase
MSAEQHDKAMADVQALTFFVARGLAAAGVSETPFMTPSFKRLLDLVQLDRAHSPDLFNTIELGNPFAAAVRERFVNSVTTLQKELNNKEYV